MKQHSEKTRTGTPIRPRGQQGGAETAGQSGDLQGLSNQAGADSESVDELLEEGQSFEAAAIMGVENTPDADVAEVHTHQMPEDDVPPEYWDREGKP